MDGSELLGRKLVGCQGWFSLDKAWIRLTRAAPTKYEFSFLSDVASLVAKAKDV